MSGELPPPPPGPAPTSPVARERAPIVVLVLAIVVAVAAATWIVLLVSGGDEPPVDLSLRSAPAQAAQFQVRATDDAEPSEILPEGSHFELSGLITIDTNEVGSDTSTLGIEVDEMRTAYAGEELPSAVSGPQQLHLDPDGTPRELVILAAGPDGTLFYYLDLAYPVVRTGKAAEGDTWPIEFDASLPAATGTASYSGTGELVGFDDIDGVHAAEVRNELSFRYAFVISAPEVAAMSGLGAVSSGTIEVDATGSLTLTAWLDPRTGRMLRAESEGTYDVTYVYEGFHPSEASSGNATIHVEGRFRSELELVR